MPNTPAPTRAGVFGMTQHHMAAALYRVAQIVQRNPGGDGNDDGFRLQGGQGFGEHAADDGRASPPMTRTSQRAAMPGISGTAVTPLAQRGSRR